MIGWLVAIVLALGIAAVVAWRLRVRGREREPGLADTARQAAIEAERRARRREREREIAAAEERLQDGRTEPSPAARLRALGRRSPSRGSGSRE